MRRAAATWWSRLGEIGPTPALGATHGESSMIAQHPRYQARSRSTVTAKGGKPSVSWLPVATCHHATLIKIDSPDAWRGGYASVVNPDRGLRKRRRAVMSFFGRLRDRIPAPSRRSPRLRR